MEQELEEVLTKVGSFFYRKGNFGDEYTVRENISGKQYHDLKPSKDDVVLDIGGHIGTFAFAIATKVRHVVSVEMDDENWELLHKNTLQFGNVKTLNVAVVPNDCEDVEIEYYRAKKNSGAHSRYVKRGRGEPFTSKTIKIDELLDDVKPTIIKCDIEGAEYDIFEKLIIPNDVKQMIFEMHFGRKIDRSRANALVQWFIGQGFASSDVSDMNENKNWTRVIYFERNLHEDSDNGSNLQSTEHLPETESAV